MAFPDPFNAVFAQVVYICNITHTMLFIVRKRLLLVLKTPGPLWLTIEKKNTSTSQIT
jgi:hypothetical protein